MEPCVGLRAEESCFLDEVIESAVEQPMQHTPTVRIVCLWLATGTGTLGRIGYPVSFEADLRGNALV